MDFQALHNRLVAKGYNDDTADAMIAHDVVLKASRKSFPVSAAYSRTKDSSRD